MKHSPSPLFSAALFPSTQAISEMMKRQQSLSSLFLFLFFLHGTKILARSSAPAPAPPGPPDIVSILQKDGHFTAFVRLLKASHVDNQIDAQLKSSSDGLTIFAPTDSAFSSLKGGLLSSLNDAQKVEFVQFHVMTEFVLMSQFDTVSNPVMTLAGSNDKLELDITDTGKSVDISTGLTKTSISGTIYADNQVAVYKVDSVLLPKDIFAAALAPANPPAGSPGVPIDASDAPIPSIHRNQLIFGLVIYSAVFFL